MSIKLGLSLEFLPSLAYIMDEPVKVKTFHRASTYQPRKWSCKLKNSVCQVPQNLVFFGFVVSIKKKYV